MTTTDRKLADKLTEPLSTVTAIFGMLFLTFVVATGLAAATGWGSFGGFGHAVVCATQPGTGYGGDTAHLGISPQPGVTISINGTLQACTLHPTFSQRLMYTFMGLPTVLVWAAVLLLLWWLLRAARSIGPFTLLVAARMRWLGWVVLLGTLAATAAESAATVALLNTLLRAQTSFGYAVANLTHVLPVPLLIWAALLTFARIVHLGTAMDEDIQGTV